MKKQVYLIDVNGYIQEVYVGVFEDNYLVGVINEQGEIDSDIDISNFATIDYPPLFKPKWNGSEWLEGESAEEKAEREAQQLLESLKPSQSEITDAELEIKFITLLTELEVIQ